MKQRTFRRIIAWMALVISLGLFMVIAFFVMTADQPPVADIEQYRAMVRRAERADAARYAPVLFQNAKQTLEALQGEWQQENRKWFFKRDFQNMREVIAESIQQAQQVEERTIELKDSLRIVLDKELAAMSKDLETFKTNYFRLPLEAGVRKDFAAGELLMLESQAAYRRGDYLLAKNKLNEGNKLVQRSFLQAEQKLQAYLENLPLWQSWAAETIAWSRENNRVAIIVEKLAHVCRVYDNGHLLAEYTAEMGPNWIGDKRHKGDKATPEGRYFVTKKKGPGKTKYYKALLINYPNPDDRKRFTEEIKNGSLPRTIDIGGLIEIHGEGGKNTNWTDGCVALVNEDMDEVFEKADVGTPVTIVGSLNGFYENKNN